MGRHAADPTSAPHLRQGAVDVLSGIAALAAFARKPAQQPAAAGQWEDDIIDFIVSRGAIPMLAAQLGSGSPALQAAALLGLRRLLRQQPAEVAAVADAPTCLRLLRDSHSPAVHAAAAALLTALAAVDTDRGPAALAAGAVPLLLHRLLGAEDPAVQSGPAWRPASLPLAVQHALARALLRLCPAAAMNGQGLFHEALFQLISRAASGHEDEAILLDTVSNMLSDDSRQCRRRSLLERSDDGRQLFDHNLARSIKLQLLLRLSAVPRAMRLLTAGNHLSRTSALHFLYYSTLVPMACSSTAADFAVAAEVTATGAVPLLLTLISGSSEARGSGRTSLSQLLDYTHPILLPAALLANICGRSACHPALLAAGTVQTIAQLLTQQLPTDVLNQLVDAVEQLSKGSSAVRRALLAAGVLPALAALGHGIAMIAQRWKLERVMGCLMAAQQAAAAAEPAAVELAATQGLGLAADTAAAAGSSTVLPTVASSEPSEAPPAPGKLLWDTALRPTALLGLELTCSVLLLLALNRP